MSECPKCKKLTYCTECSECSSFECNQKWISVKDRLPSKDGRFLTRIIDNGCSYSVEVQKYFKIPRILKGMYGDSNTHWEKTKWDDHVVTHWMPLPEAPDD